MKKNVIPLVAIALVVAVASTGIFYGLIVSRMDGSSNQSAQTRFITSKPSEKGHLIAADDFRLMAAPDPGAPTPLKAEDLTGRTTKETVEAGKVLTEAMLSPIAERMLQSGIPAGLRAVTIHVSDSSSVVKMLQAGARIDVQAVIHHPKPGETDVEARTLLQNVVVYNVSGESNPNMQGRTVVTVLATPQDAERLSAADAGARLRVALRNPKDQQIVPLGSTSLSNLNAPPRPVVTSSFVAASPVKPHAVAPVEYEVSLVEVSSEEAAGIAPNQKSGTLTVSSFDEARIQELRKSSKLNVLASSRLMPGKSGEFSWKASDEASMRVRIEPLSISADGRQSLRIQPETTVPQSGTAATRRVDSQISLGRNQSAIVGGLLPAAQVAQLRERLNPGGTGGGELLMVITQVNRN
ncbi:MAG: Flp pilus assembly protein CpaB [Acidobacteria bacterium]|nr:Flp pilus assembly protein CpaB [Acidobacteriota bacterium]